MLALGFLHGLGADHLMAIAALSLATPLGPARYARAFGLALRFAVGHARAARAGRGAGAVFRLADSRAVRAGRRVRRRLSADRARAHRGVADRVGPPLRARARARRRRAARAQPLASAPRPPAFPSAVDSHHAAGRARRGVRGERPARAHPVAAAVELDRRRESFLVAAVSRHDLRASASSCRCRSSASCSRTRSPIGA